MTWSEWNAVDSYINAMLVQSNPALDAALQASAQAGLPAIHVSPSQGKFLYLLALVQGASKILEIGTLGGYSTIWLARALPEGGRLITLEADPKHAQVAQSNIRQAGLSDVVELRLGRALDTLPQLADEGIAPFDFIFLDADKPNNPSYFQWALKLSRVGSLIIVDNVVRDGRVVDADSDDSNIQGARDLIGLMGAEPRVSSTVIQTVGSKGYDGLAIALVVSDP
jgi:predicted O-methyltransferase YrrM